MSKDLLETVIQEMRDRVLHPTEGLPHQIWAWADRLSSLPPSQVPEPFGPHADCWRCHGTGECDNAQFKCICRHHRHRCALLRGRGDCDCKPLPPSPVSPDGPKRLLCPECGGDDIGILYGDGPPEIICDDCGWRQFTGPAGIPTKLSPMSPDLAEATAPRSADLRKWVQHVPECHVMAGLPCEWRDVNDRTWRNDVACTCGLSAALAGQPPDAQQARMESLRAELIAARDEVCRLTQLINPILPGEDINSSGRS